MVTLRQHYIFMFISERLINAGVESLITTPCLLEESKDIKFS